MVAQEDAVLVQQPIQHPVRCRPMDGGRLCADLYVVDDAFADACVEDAQSTVLTSKTIMKRRM